MGGRYNSSITRVRPYFQRLIREDPTGRSWLPRLLRLAPQNRAYAQTLAAASGELVATLTTPRPYSDRILKTYGVSEIKLEACFEYPVPPSEALLRWLVMNPGTMKTPDWNAADWNPQTLRDRRRLFGPDRFDQTAAQQEALAELARCGARGSKRKWWAFEGWTDVDCYLETDRLLLLVEGKRTETLSGSTCWLPERNQLIRNLEAAGDIAGGQGGKPFAVLLMAERQIDVPEAWFEDGLPHYDVQQRRNLADHFLGCVTWAEAMSVICPPLPDTVEEVVGEMRLRPDRAPS